MMNFKKAVTRVVRSRNFSPSVMTAIIVAAVIFANAFIYMLYVYTRPSATVAEKEDLSISDAVKEDFDNAAAQGKHLTITFCMSEADIQNHSEGKFVRETVMNYADKYSDFISIRYANIFTLEYDDASGEKFSPEKYQKVARKDASGEILLDKSGNPIYDEYKISRSSVIFECETFDQSGNLLRSNIRVVSGSSAFVDFFTLDANSYVTSYNGEEVFAAMAFWVINDQHETVYFTTGHGEVPSTNFYYSLLYAGYYIDEINLRKESVPEDAAFVIISNPKTDFEKAANDNYVSELMRLKEYSDNGGAFYVILDPLAKSLPRLEEFVSEEFGISVKTNDDGERLMVKDLNQSVNTQGFTGFTLLADYADNSVAQSIKNKIDGFGGSVIINDAAALECNESLGARPLLTSSASASLVAGGENEGEDGPHTVIACSEKKVNFDRSAKMIFISSVYLAASDAMVSNNYANKDFLYALYDEFYDGPDMPYGIDCVEMQEERLENLTLGTSILYTCMLLAIPVVLAAVGTVTIIRRKNR